MDGMVVICQMGGLWQCFTNMIGESQHFSEHDGCSYPVATYSSWAAAWGNVTGNHQSGTFSQLWLPLRQMVLVLYEYSELIVTSMLIWVGLGIHSCYFVAILLAEKHALAGDISRFRLIPSEKEWSLMSAKWFESGQVGDSTIRLPLVNSDWVVHAWFQGYSQSILELAKQNVDTKSPHEFGWQNFDPIKNHQKSMLDSFSPPARWGLLDFMSDARLLLLPPPRRFSSASSWSQWASPDLICQLLIAVSLAGSHLPALDRLQPARAWALWASPDLNRREPERCGPRRTSTGEGRSAVGLAGPQPSTGEIRSTVGLAGPQPARFCAVGQPDLNGQKQSHIECQGISQIECQKICPIECQKICQIECQKIFQIECQKICQIECQKIFQIECQKICQIECQTECQKMCQIECQKICQTECQKICQIECPKICQIECQKICQIECQKICQIECQKICQMECQIECQIECQKICQIESQKIFQI